MNTLTISLALIATLGFVGCSRSSHDNSSHPHDASAARPYPLTKCLVTDEGFNHGEPYTFVHEGQTIKLCCEDCLADFKKEPAKYLSKLTSK